MGTYDPLINNGRNELLSMICSKHTWSTGRLCAYLTLRVVVGMNGG